MTELSDQQAEVKQLAQSSLQTLQEVTPTHFSIIISVMLLDIPVGPGRGRD